MKTWRYTGHHISQDWEDQGFHKGTCHCGLLMISGTYEGLRAKMIDHRGTETAAGKQKSVN